MFEEPSRTRTLETVTSNVHQLYQSVLDGLDEHLSPHRSSCHPNRLHLFAICFTWTSCLVTIFYIRRKDRYQGWFLILGLGISYALNPLLQIAGFAYQNQQYFFFGLLFPIISLALIISAVCHSVFEMGTHERTDARSEKSITCQDERKEIVG